MCAQVTNANGLNITLPEGVSFGEGALVTMVRREATVRANEACHLVQLTADACEGMSCDLKSLRLHVICQMLSKIKFFAAFNNQKLRIIAELCEIEYYHLNQVCVASSITTPRYTTASSLSLPLTFTLHPPLRCLSPSPFPLPFLHTSNPDYLRGGRPLRSLLYYTRGPRRHLRRRVAKDQSL